MKCHCKMVPQHRMQHKHQRQHDSDRCDRQTAVIFSHFLRLFLTFCLTDIKVAETDHTIHSVPCKDHDTNRSSHTKAVGQQNRKCPKADHVTQGIDLNTKTFFIIRTVCLSSGNFSVKHVTQSRKSQAQHCHLIPPVHSKQHPRNGTKQTDIRQNHRVIVITNKTYHEFPLFLSYPFPFSCIVFSFSLIFSLCSFSLPRNSCAATVMTALINSSV